ncbi:MAG: NAD(P)-dependent oxidoreductase [Actinomycetota bacterium]
MVATGVNRSGRPAEGAAETAPVSALPDLLPEADWVVLALALTPQTRGLFDAAMLGRMKPDAWLVNVARGALVDTDALVEALRSGRIGGAALDVTEPEPLPEDHALWPLDDVIITSHSASTDAMALPELAARVRRNVERFAQGRPLEGVVDPGLGY